MKTICLLVQDMWMWLVTLASILIPKAIHGTTIIFICIHILMAIIIHIMVTLNGYKLRAQQEEFLHQLWNNTLDLFTSSIAVRAPGIEHMDQVIARFTISR